jgi:hypothetical protein
MTSEEPALETEVSAELKEMALRELVLSKQLRDDDNR